MTRTAVLHPDLRKPDAPDPEGALEEALNLTQAIDLELVFGETIRVAKPVPATLFGAGKVEELDARLRGDEVELVILNGPLSPVQQRNLERAWKVKILDRTGLILEIFGERAQTREGVLQVELAHLEYQKTRLVRSWTHLERQRGGLGFVGGPGETQIEADRRMINERIISLKKQLSKVVKTRELHRAARKKVPFPIVALVGYTNAGKSTLFNRLTDAEVRAEDMLFATLDPTMRQIALPSGRTAILSDTVGFISDLPTQLVAAFRATLEEVLAADLIVHVRDIAHPDSNQQRLDVLKVLGDLGIEVEGDGAETLFEVLNKIDLLEPEAAQAIRTRAAKDPQCVATSAITGEGQDTLLQRIDEILFSRRLRLQLSFRHQDGAAISWLYRHSDVSAREDTDTGSEITVEMTEREFFQFQKEFSNLGRIIRQDRISNI